MNVIEVKGLVKKFGSFRAVDNISFEVDSGEFFGFLGPNGAGKTTTINILTTLLKPTEGRALVAGHDVSREKHKVRKSIGIVFQEGSLDDSLTAFEHLKFHGVFYDVPKKVYRARIEELLEIVGLEDRRNSLVKTFSGGMRRRLEIARGLIHRPRVLFLDEPTLGLDVQTRILVWDYIRSLGQREDVTIFLTTHNMEEAEFADRIAVIDHGNIIALDTPANLKKLVGKDIVMVQTAHNAQAKKEIKERWNVEAKEIDEHLVLEIENGPEFTPVLVRELSVAVEAISTRGVTLEDVFLHLTGRSIRDEGRDPESGFQRKLKIGR